jgi:hypothetical protein
MTEHIPISQMKRFCVRALAGDDLLAVGEHVSGCGTCHRQFTETLRTLRMPSSFRLTLGREFWIRHEHVDYEQLVEIADNKLDTADREVLDIHLNTCAPCREDVRSFLVFRDELAKDVAVSFASALPRPPGQRVSIWTRWSAPAWKPAYAAVIAIIAIAIVAAVIIIKRKTANLEAVRTPLQNNGPVIVQTPTPERGVAGNNLAPLPSNLPPNPKPSPTLTVKNRTPAGAPERISSAIALSDVGGRTVTIDQKGAVSGLDDVAPATRDEIAKALTEEIRPPEILTRLSATDITLRGPNNGQPFKLRSPIRTVVVSDQPSFEWDKFPAATSYRVYVGDLKGHEVAKSDELSPDQTKWKPPARLTRGEIYSWAVAAVVDGKEVMSPGAAAPEMKFQVLSASDLQNLKQLKGTHSHLVLGVFYVKAGLLTEGERELRGLVHLNHDDEVPKRLLRSVRLMLGTLR